MLDDIYHMTLKLIKNPIFGMIYRKVNILPSFMLHCNGRHCVM